LTDNKYWRVTWFCILVAFFNQFSGVNAISIYSTKLFTGLNISTKVGSIIVGVSQFFGAIAGGSVAGCGFGYRGMMIAA
jgi:hypothetical protein